MASQQQHDRFRITPVHDKLLRGTAAQSIGLYQLHLATAEQLTRLHYSPASLTYVKEHLKALRDHGYVVAGTIPTIHHGVPFYYALGPMGCRYLAQLGFDTADSYRASKEVDKSWLFLKHALELGDVIVSAALLKAEAISLGTFKTDRLLRRGPVTVTVAGRTVQLVPDALLGFRVGEARPRVIVEHDRGTEGKEHFRRRIRAYVADLHTHPRPVAFTTFEGERRRDQLRAWTNSELNGAVLPFYFAALERPPRPEIWISPVWYTAYDGPPRALLGE